MKCRNLLILPLALAIVSCNEPQTISKAGGTPITVPATPSDASLVMLVREYAEPTLWGITIEIDGKKVASLKNESFTWAVLPPGKHELKGKWAGLSGQKDCSLSFETMAGTKSYIAITGQSKLVGWAPSPGAGPAAGLQYAMGSGAQVISPEKGEAMIATKPCRLISPAS